MSNAQHPSPHQPVATTWTEPPWCGWIETTRDALLILEAARRGLIPRVTRRLVDSERKMITSGSVFVFDEDESGIKRWTDGYFWSPSRILGNFLLYRETDKRGAGHKNIRVDQEGSEDGFNENSSLSLPKNNPGAIPVDKHRERSLVGSLTNSYKFKPDGLMKKTFSLTIGGVAQHLISYYKIEDVESGRLRSPSSLPELASLDISPEYLDKTHFRNPPKIEIGADGIPRFKGESDDVEVSPTAIAGPLQTSPMPPLLSEGRMTEVSSKRPRRFDPYAPPSVGRSRRNNTRSPAQDGPNASGEKASPVASGNNTPLMAAKSPPAPAQPEQDTQMTVSLPPAISHYGMPASYYPGYPPAPLHFGPVQAGVAMGPYPPPAPGTNNNGATSRSSIAPKSPSHIPKAGAAQPIHYGPSTGYLNTTATTTVAHPSNPSASPNLTMSTQVRVSDLSQAGLVPMSSQQPGPAPVAAPAPVQPHSGQVPSYGHGPPQYPYAYYPPPPLPAQFQSQHGYPSASGPVAYHQWPYAAYTVPPQPSHPSAGQQHQASVVASYAPQTTQPQHHGAVAAGSTQAKESDAETEETENV